MYVMCEEQKFIFLEQHILCQLVWELRISAKNHLRIFIFKNLAMTGSNLWPS